MSLEDPSSQASHSHLSLSQSVSPDVSATSSPAPGEQPITITTTVGSGPNKRKEIMTLPLPPGALPPRKRAKTKDEKEQRRIERIMRNRQAAHASREKKRRHVEELEKKCVSLASENEQLHSGFHEMKSQTSLLVDKFKSLASLIESAKSSGGLDNINTQKLLADAMAVLKPVEVPTPSNDEFLEPDYSSQLKESSPDEFQTPIKSEPVHETSRISSPSPKAQIKAEPSITNTISGAKSNTSNKNSSNTQNNNSTSSSSTVKTETSDDSTSRSATENTTNADSPYSDSGSPLSVPSLSSSVASSPRAFPLDITNNTSESDLVMGLEHPSSFLGLLEYRSHHPAEMMCT